MSELKQATTLLRPDARIRADSERSLGVDQALKLDGAVDTAEVYVGWGSQPVSVAFRGYRAGVQTWAVAGPLLRERVMLALRPLLAAEWQLAGAFAESARWDMSKGSGGDLYEGCWVRLRRTS
jgi:hypothetical protein